MAKIGDIVRFLNSVGGGRVTKIKDNIAYVEDEDGFETPVLLSPRIGIEYLKSVIDGLEKKI